MRTIPMELLLNGVPVGASTSASFIMHRLASGTSDVMTIVPRPARSTIQGSAVSGPLPTTNRSSRRRVVRRSGRSRAHNQPARQMLGDAAAGPRLHRQPPLPIAEHRARQHRGARIISIPRRSPSSMGFPRPWMAASLRTAIRRWRCFLSPRCRATGHKLE
jgi:hypothetical protein